MPPFGVFGEQCLHSQVKPYVSFRDWILSDAGSVISTYVVKSYINTISITCSRNIRGKNTSAFAGMSWIATTCNIGSVIASGTFSRSGRGNTTATFGSQLWFISAVMGDNATPIGLSEGDVSVKELQLNYYSKEIVALGYI